MTKGSDALSIQDGTFSWADTSDSKTLNDVELRVQDGSLTAVVGQVGCGKSSLLAAIMGELHKVKGRVNRMGSLGYVPQEAWLRNQTIKDNILFHKDLDQMRYQGILDACALNADLKILADGDMTVVGEKGVTLSGGQKQRVSLARAVYQDADVYLMDDPLSAVDSHVGKHIFEQVLGPDGLLKNKTRILVTHGIAHLPKMDQIVVMKDGRISECGTYDDLIQQDGPFAEFTRTYLNNCGDTLSEHTSGDNDLDKDWNKGAATLMRPDLFASSVDEDSALQNSTENQNGIPSGKNDISEPDTKEKGSNKADGVHWSVLFSYLNTFGYLGVFYLISHVIVSVCEFGSDIWLSQWTKDFENNVTESYSMQHETVKTRLGIYAVLGISTGVMTIVESILLTISCNRASMVLHQVLLDRITKAPMSYFNSTPLGKILNCFGHDMQQVDTDISTNIAPMLKAFTTITTTIIAISLTSPVFLAALIPLGVVYYFIERFFTVTLLQLRRTAQGLSSPMFSHVSESIIGAASIRAYQQQGIFIKENDRRCNEYQKIRFASMANNRWFTLWLEVWSGLIVFLSALLAVRARSSLSVGLVGLSISYALKISDTLALCVRRSSELENSVISLERIQQHSSVEQEAPWHEHEEEPTKAWPKIGEIVFRGYSTRYQPGQDLVLKGINCVIHGGEKVGVVGRTGAGKSSVTLSLFRIIEAVEGSIVIDDVNTSKIGLHDLRKQLTIIPQDPVMFSGSLLFNLDPFNENTDDDIYGALDLVHLKSFVLALPDQLEFTCAESGSNISVGQRQLVCLARALLRKTKILVLDEATAAVDLETDELIQNTIRTEFQNCTVITIAHRVNTVMDYDRILVMKNGRIVEFDTPSKLLRNNRSDFFIMCKDAGIA